MNILISFSPGVDRHNGSFETVSSLKSCGACELVVCDKPFAIFFNCYQAKDLIVRRQSNLAAELLLL